MPYVADRHPNSARYADERELLLAGLSYAEVAEQTGQRARTISERNRLIHKVDLWDAFARRVQSKGVPCRMPADLAAVAWFVGMVDGEGSFLVSARPRSRGWPHTEFRLGLRIQLRDDDAEAIDAIREITGVGIVSRHAPLGGPTNPSIAWMCERVTDLTEVLVPIFDAVPLRTKKAREYAIWRGLVLRRYADTLGGHSRRHKVTEEYRATFQQAVEAIAEIRRYGAVARPEINPERPVVSQDAAHSSEALHEVL